MDLAASEVQMIVSKTFARFGAESHDFEKREIFHSQVQFHSYAPESTFSRQTINNYQPYMGTIQLLLPIGRVPQCSITGLSRGEQHGCSHAHTNWER